VKKLVRLIKVVAVIQLVLGAFYLLAPGWFLGQMGHSAPEADIYYPLGMLASRFIAYGVALWIIAGSLNSQTIEQSRLWMTTLILIQSIDLLVGIYYTFMGAVPIQLSGFPMFNAVWIIILAVLWLPSKNSNTTNKNALA